MTSTQSEIKVGDKVITRKVGEAWEYGGDMPDGARGIVHSLEGSHSLKVQLDEAHMGIKENWWYAINEVRLVETDSAPAPQLRSGQIWLSPASGYLLLCDENRVVQLRSGVLLLDDYSAGDSAPTSWTYVAHSFDEALREERFN